VRAYLRRIRKTYLADIHKKLAEDHKTLFLRSLISVQPLRHVAPPLLERDYVETARKISIVIVDDDSVMRKALATLLSALGYCVQSYASASAFFTVAATTEAACLILDIQLGAESGIELARRLAASGSSFPIIFMTGSDDERLRRNALDAGTVALLLKPFRVEELMSALSKAIGSR